MILCGCTKELDGRVARGGCGHPPPRQKSGGGWRKAEQVKNNGVAT